MGQMATAHWERLGWTFIAKARRSFDPGFYKLAEQCALCLAAQQPNSAEALLLQGYVLHQMHRFPDAETLARQLVAQRGLWFDYGLLGDVLMEQGKLADAVDAYQRMMDQKPGPQAYSRAAHLRWLTGDLAGAIAVMQMATGMGGSHDSEAAAWFHVRLALYEWQAGHVSQASTHLEAALALQPEYPPALLARGRMLLADSNAATALEPLTRAAQLNPLPEYQWVLSDALRAAGQVKAAQAVAMHLKQRSAVEDRRTFALYLATTGQEIETAVRLAEEELAVRADVFTLDTLAWALHAAGRYDEARTVSERALTVGTQEARLFYHAGVIAAAVGQADEATHWFARATALSQMLLPSEREHLAQASARVQTPHTVLAEQ
jgi:tetratricopeptide (TPR) repeat protein